MIPSKNFTTAAIIFALWEILILHNKVTNRGHNITFPGHNIKTGGHFAMGVEHFSTPERLTSTKTASIDLYPKLNSLLAAVRD